MKKIITCLFAVSILSVAAFSRNFFSQRYFETKVGGSLGVSNNLLTANDFFTRDLVIDLRSLADECPDGGFNIRTNAAPVVETNLNIKDFHLGFVTGVDMYQSMEIGKGLFDFLGYGNSIGETVKVDMKNYADIFAYSQVNLGLKFGKLKVKVQPTVFLPIASIRGTGAEITAVNDSDGNININMDMNMDIYSIVELESVNDFVGFNAASLETAFLKGYGFDFGGGIAYELSKSLSVGADFRIPIIPGHLNYKSNIQKSFEYSMNMLESGSNSSEPTSSDTVITNKEVNLPVHRPLKLNVYIDKNFLGTLFNARAGAGFGIKMPYTKDALFYPEYYLGFTLNLINVFKLGVSSQYTNQVFIHQLGTTLNVRIIQIDVGVSSQSSSFKKSLSVSGVGVYTYITVGF